MPPGKPKNKDLQLIADIDRTLHAPARLMILAMLHIVESADFIFLMNQTGLTRGNLSTHLNKLEENKYIDIKKRFVGKKPRTLIRLTERGRSAIKNYRKNMRQVVDDLLE
ncbi:MAG: transcriptional regulator [Anaerolineaceae bacterium]|nr:MAG: transcriptional regulator [Anaerolineaceae bacterium]